MAADIHDLHAQVTAKPGYTAIKNATASSITVSKNGAVFSSLVIFEKSRNRITTQDGCVGDADRWLASLK